mmetsp:Transcript_2467/g.9797  ORF Transcript_2467/g.9797 Transcript_2467/m.9797 type:complete len:235 (-) Transcript_2467:1765-2469(-)
MLKPSHTQGTLASPAAPASRWQKDLADGPRGHPRREPLGQLGQHLAGHARQQRRDFRQLLLRERAAAVAAAAAPRHQELHHLRDVLDLLAVFLAHLGHELERVDCARERDRDGERRDTKRRRQQHQLIARKGVDGLHHLVEHELPEEAALLGQHERQGLTRGATAAVTTAARRPTERRELHGAERRRRQPRAVGEDAAELRGQRQASRQRRQRQAGGKRRQREAARERQRRRAG